MTNKNKAIRIFFIISLAIHIYILFYFNNIFSVKTPEKRIEIELKEIKEEKSPQILFTPKRVKQVIPNLNPIKGIEHQIKLRQYPKTVAEPIKEIEYEPISITDAFSFFPKHYKFNNINKNSAKEKTSPISYYLQLVKQKIEKNKRYPLLARNKGIEGEVLLKFEILKNGKVKSIKIVKSSHYQILDKAAIESIKKANPFPPFPKELKENSLIINISLRFELKDM
ncbi:MAG: energy transducer TonB [Candidatus Desulfofervidus auxilii]|nr:energy transducer TonB [Candidatus Desulfofervidus auxilii]